MKQSNLFYPAGDILFSHHMTEKTVFEPHKHTLCEVLYCLGGQAEEIVNGKARLFGANTLIFLPPGVEHGLKQVNNGELLNRYILHFSDTLLSEEMRALLPFSPAQALYMEEIRFANEFSAMQSYLSLPTDMRNDAFRQRVLAMFNLLCALIRHNQDSASNASYLLPDRVLDYIEIHLSEIESLSQLAQEFYISKNQLGRVILSKTGMTTMEYIRVKRLAYVKRLCEEDGVTETEAAYMAGFRDYSTYYRNKKNLTDKKSDNAHESAQC